jgi:uncharacterized protein YkwD
MKLRTVTLALWAVLIAPAFIGCNSDSDQVPAGAYCDPVSDWSSDRQAWESRMLELFNQVRAAGANCGSNGDYSPAGPLTMEPSLRCASRVHSMDMHDRNFFDHTNPDGEGPVDRFTLADWSGGGWGENIIAGYGSAEAAFDGWMASDGHCANIMNPGFNQVGIGYFSGSSGYGDYGTAGFGSN